jgi:SAM-dependent methyltransferase
MELLRSALAGLSLERVLDVGCGSGRLVTSLAGRDAAYVGMDIEDQPLRDARARGPRTPPLVLLKANAGRIPFHDAVFSTVVLVRLYHRFPDPSAVLGELRRVLQPGGILIVEVFPRSTLSTLLHDLWAGWAEPRSHSSLTFSRKGRLTVTSGRNPGFVEILGLTRRRLRETGFHIVRELGGGFEELPFLRRFPKLLWIRLGERLRKSIGFPYVLIVAKRV